MPRFEVSAVVATTDRIPARGVRLAPEALHGIAERFRPGMPIFKNHGATRIGEWHRVEVRRRPDGEFALIAEGVVEVPEGETYEGYLGPAWSIAFTETPSLRGNEIAIVGIDSLAFEQLGLDGASPLFDNAADRVAIAWYHQFAAEPQPAIALELLANAIPILQGAGGAALWSLINLGIVRLLGRLHPKYSSATFRISGPGGFRLDAEVPTDPENAPEVVKGVLDGAAKLFEKARTKPAPAKGGRTKRKPGRKKPV